MRGQMLKTFLSEKKLLNAILRAKLKHMKNVSNEMNSFLQCRRQIFMSLSFFAEKVILELKCTKSLFRASENTKCFSANTNYENARPQMLKKHLSQWEKLLNAIL